MTRVRGAEARKAIDAKAHLTEVRKAVATVYQCMRRKSQRSTVKAAAATWALAASSRRHGRAVRPRRRQRLLTNQLNASPAQLALTWLTAQAGVVAIPEASTLAHLSDNLRLASADVERRGPCRTRRRLSVVSGRVPLATGQGHASGVIPTERPLLRSCGACDCATGRRPSRAATRWPACRCAGADRRAHGRSGSPCRAA